MEYLSFAAVLIFYGFYKWETISHGETLEMWGNTCENYSECAKRGIKYIEENSRLKSILKANGIEFISEDID